MKATKSITILCSIVILLTSCDDFLEPREDNRLLEDQVFSNPVFAEGVLLNAYDELPDSYGFTDVATDNAVTNNLGSNLLRIATGEWKSTLNPMGEWNTAYTQIYYLNLFLQKHDEVEWSWENEDVNMYYIQRMKGEAYALRAWYEFKLLQAHAGLTESGELLGFPIVTDVLTVNDDLELPRDTYDDCLQHILADCDTALANLSEEYIDTGDPIYDDVYGTNFRNRMNGKTVRALISRITLHAASPSFTVNLTEAEKLDRLEIAARSAGDMLADIGGVAGLSPGGHTFYIPTTVPALVFDPELIWRSDHDLNNGIERNNYPPSLFGNGRTNPSQNLVDAFPMANGYPIDHALSGYDPANPYVNRDPRLDQNIVYNGSKMRKFYVINTSITGDKDGINATPNSTKTGYYLRKFMNPDASVDPSVSNNAYHYYTFFRYTELFLNYAEAANEAWGPDADPEAYGFTARDIIQAIRSRAGISASDDYLTSMATADDMRGLIQNERRLELCFEDFRFWDLRRLGEAIDEDCMGVYINEGNYDYQLIEERKYEDYMYYGPIPYTETLMYDLTQNRGW